MRKIFKRERGFSLIELAVVVAIIGILAAIAIPTFLGQREGAQDRQAQSSLRNAVTVARAVAAATDDSTYPGELTDDDDPNDVTPSDKLAEALENAEPSLTFQATGSDEPTEVSVNRVSDNTVVLAAYSRSGKCWFVRSTLNAVDGNGDAGTYYGVAAAGELADDPAANCNANHDELDDAADIAAINGTSFGNPATVDLTPTP